jgi:protein-S-isoprenylcysteine O-methyltransferase Ste14
MVANSNTAIMPRIRYPRRDPPSGTIASVLAHKYYVDSHKALTGAFVLALIAAYHAWDNVLAWIYFGLHGTYGLLWVLKSRSFGDKNWERPVPLWMGAGTWLILSLYWISPWLIVTGRNHPMQPWMIGVCIAMYSLGVFLHFASDMQKHLIMKYRKGTLLTDGLWGLCRNPNYLGELLIYLGFTLLPMHWLPLAGLGLVVRGVWVPNMRRKDKSLSRYPEFAAYKAHTKLIIPYVV